MLPLSDSRPSLSCSQGCVQTSPHNRAPYLVTIIDFVTYSGVHTRTHACTHARGHTHTHTDTQRTQTNRTLTHTRRHTHRIEQTHTCTHAQNRQPYTKNSHAHAHTSGAVGVKCLAQGHLDTQSRRSRGLNRQSPTCVSPRSTSCAKPTSSRQTE